MNPAADDGSRSRSRSPCRSPAASPLPPRGRELARGWKGEAPRAGSAPCHAPQSGLPSGAAPCGWPLPRQRRLPSHHSGADGNARRHLNRIDLGKEIRSTPGQVRRKGPSAPHRRYSRDSSRRSRARGRLPRATLDLTAPGCGSEPRDEAIIKTRPTITSSTRSASAISVSSRPRHASDDARRESTTRSGAAGRRSLGRALPPQAARAGSGVDDGGMWQRFTELTSARRSAGRRGSNAIRNALPFPVGLRPHTAAWRPSLPVCCVDFRRMECLRSRSQDTPSCGRYRCPLRAAP